MLRASWFLRVLTGFYGTLVLASCGDDVTGTPGNLQLSLTTSRGSILYDLAVPAGGSGEAVVTVVRPSGFRGTVRVTAGGLPSGVSAEEITIDGDSRTGVLSIRATTNAATVRELAASVEARGDNVGSAYAPFELTILSRASIDLTLAPETVTLVQGDTVSVRITVNYVGSAVNLTVADVPDGMTAAFDPASVTSVAGISRLRLAASPTLSPGSYPLTVRASAASASDDEATLTVSVTPAASTVAARAESTKGKSGIIDP